MHSIKINSNGTAWNTKVFNQDGSEIYGITAIDISIRPGGVVQAKLSFDLVVLEIQADWCNHSLKQWADKKIKKSLHIT